MIMCLTHMHDEHVTSGVRLNELGVKFESMTHFSRSKAMLDYHFFLQIIN